MIACKRLLSKFTLDKSAESTEQARRLERIIDLLAEHSPDDLPDLEGILEKTANVKDRAQAFAVARAEVEKQPVKEKDEKPAEEALPAEAAATRK
jgi:hypothetical protein